MNYFWLRFCKFVCNVSPPSSHLSPPLSVYSFPTTHAVNSGCAHRLSAHSHRTATEQPQNSHLAQPGGRAIGSNLEGDNSLGCRGS